MIETPTNSRRPAAGSPTRASFSPFPICVDSLEQCCGFYFCLRFYTLLPSDEMMDPFLSARDMYRENNQATFVSTCDFRLLLLSLYIPPHLTIDSFRVHSGCLVLYRYGVNESAQSSDCHHNNIGRERYGRCIYSKGNTTFDSNIPIHSAPHWWCIVWLVDMFVFNWAQLGQKKKRKNCGNIDLSGIENNRRNASQPLGTELSWVCIGGPFCIGPDRPKSKTSRCDYIFQIGMDKSFY